MNYILFDDYARNNLLPLTFLRPVADIRVGILTIREKWEKYLGVATSTLTETYLSAKFPIVKGQHNILINGSVLPNAKLVKEIGELTPNQALVNEDVIIAMFVEAEDLDKIGDGDTGGIREVKTLTETQRIQFTWDIVSGNAQAIEDDFKLITKGRKSEPIPDGTKVAGDQVFIEKGAEISMAFINAKSGPVYIGKDAVVMEGAALRGPVALCEHSVVKMATILYGATTIGPYSKVGGEIENSILFGYSNKPHGGFLGSSVIAEWCNLAAGTNTSNLNNNYKNVKAWCYTKERFVDTGLQFLGLIMGDHSKSGIDTMFNTGTVVGVSSNVYGAGYHRNYVSSFIWGSTAGYVGYDINRAIEVAELVYQRRAKVFDDTEQSILREVYELTYHNSRK